MQKKQYLNNVEFKFQHPKDIGIKPPEGKELSDFVCWMGFEDKDEPYPYGNKGVINLPDEEDSNHTHSFLLSSLCLYRPDDTGTVKIRRSLVTQESMPSINFYAVWDKYGFESDNHLRGGYPAAPNSRSRPQHISQVGFGNLSVLIDTYDIFGGESFDEIGFPTTSVDTNDGMTRCFSHQRNLIPNLPICFYINPLEDEVVTNVYINGKLLAGIDVTDEYLERHANDLYYGWSDDPQWMEPLSNGYREFIFPITSCHVSSDNIMHISCETNPLSSYLPKGDVNLYQSYEEAKTKMDI